ncbi:MAG TPA: peptidoglycan bridge formation glycyltransferase FemA/FemB family protein [Anaerolineae bacterium]|nr:peptidoglycan bridge formation glycyltransferase FemA/FemB family protein [Anaerolineae bacterium]
MDIKLVHGLPEDKWRNYVEQHPQGNIFHTPEMFQVFSRTKGYQPALLSATLRGDRVLALLSPVQITLGDGPLRRLRTRAVAYGSVLYDPGPAGASALTTLMHAYVHKTSAKLLFTELRNLADLSAARPVLARHGFAHEDHLTYLIDLDRPANEVWRALHKSGRKAIRRSVHRGVTVQELDDRSLLPAYYDLIRQTYARAQIPLADISLFEAVFDVLVSQGMAKMLLARVADDYVAASLELLYKDVIYSWYSGYDRAFRYFYPNDILVWHILEWGATHGYRCYDFGGAGRPDQAYGVRNFKAKFGGQLVNLGRYTYVHAPLALMVSRAGYALYRTLLRYRPARRSAPTTVTQLNECAELHAG